MHASGMKTFVALALLGCSNATPALRRAASDIALNPWVTVDGNGVASTITPVATTINGVATTLNLAPAALTATGTVSVTATAVSSGASSTATGGGAFEVCSSATADIAPFCKPANGDVLYTSETYYVTFDASGYSFASNSTVKIQGNYVNVTDGGPQAFEYNANMGYLALTVSSDWLKSKSSNNVTLFITSMGKSITGPTVKIMNRPAVYPVPDPTPVPKGAELYIALPTVFGFILLCVVGGFFWNRKSRKIGLGNVMGRRKGYGTGKSRRQRLGLSKKAGAIRLREQELTAEGQYRDVPIEQQARVPAHYQEHRRNDSDNLGDLVSTPTDDRHRGNVFRDEMKRQDQNRI